MALQTVALFDRAIPNRTYGLVHSVNPPPPTLQAVAQYFFRPPGVPYGFAEVKVRASCTPSSFANFCLSRAGSWTPLDSRARLPN